MAADNMICLGHMIGIGVFQKRERLLGGEKSTECPTRRGSDALRQCPQDGGNLRAA